MARSRTYRHDLRCPHCGSNWTPKDGHSRGKQTYRGGDCHYRFTPEGNRHYYPQSVKDQALEMYGEGSSIAAIGRVLGVLPETVFSWVKKSPLGQGCDGLGSTPPHLAAAEASPSHRSGRDVDLRGGAAQGVTTGGPGLDGGDPGSRRLPLGGLRGRRPQRGDLSAVV